ncbi:MAG: hypothetical protein ACLPXT_16135 [Terracidiphilus sp.]
MYTQSFRIIFTVLLFSLLAPLLQAQPSVPQSYTLTASTAMALESMATGSAVDVKVSRFGPREFVDVTAPSKAGKAVHAQHWFDLVAHKAYSLDLTKNTCSWMTYTGPDMPTMYDPVATPPPSAEDLAKFKKTTVRQENVNGIAAYLTESSSDQGKASIWVAVNGYYPVKAIMTFPGAQPLLMLEVKQLRFEKPSAALFTPPANCPTQAQGEWSATSISSHFETNINVQGSGSLDLGAGKTTGKATVKSTTKPK